MIARLTSVLAERYVVERELGAGGMATVYLAHDRKHDRDVAIKVLHPDLGAALGVDRFLSEIKTTAKLQHPHILPLLDSGEADGLLYYVMPVVTGETLRARLERERQLPIPDAVRIAREVASALDYAHRQGVIHRDIKPENILLHDGQALVADFGIALAVQTAAGQRMTQTGLSLGTPQYMSPEQAMGEKQIDARTDVYALGAVTYEMLAGDAPFTGSSVQAIVAKVLTERPTPLHTLRDTVPAAVENAVLTALAKLPADRFATAAEFGAALANSSGAGASDPAWTRELARLGWRAKWSDPIVLALGVVVVGLAVALLTLARARSGDVDPFPARIELAVAAPEANLRAALSPDGRTVAFVGPAPAGPGTMLYLRRLDQLSSRAIVGTNDAWAPTFSPDGNWVAFIAGRRRLVKVPLDGGAPVPLAEVPDYGGIDWSSSGEIVVGPGIMEGLSGLLRISANGGTLQPLTRVDSTRKELSHEWPRVLADGRTVLFTIWNGSVDQAQIAATSLDDGKVVPLGIMGTMVLDVVGGQLVYMRADGMAMAVPFDVRNRRATGVATPVQDSIRVANSGHATAFLTHAGGLLMSHGNPEKHLVWVDRAGKVTPVLNEALDYEFVRASPSGRQLAVVISSGARSDLWTLDIATTTLTRLTTTGRTRNPAWSPDGRRILYTSTHGGRAALWWQPADGSGPSVLAAEPRYNQWNLDLSPDGRTAVFNALYDGTFNLRSISLDSVHEEIELAASPTASETWGRFSPDGRAIAYSSDESGRMEVFVRPFPEQGGRVQISGAGGRRPIWAPDGRRIYYRDGTKVMAATLARDPSLRVVSREALFDGRYEMDFDISKDGTRFLMIQSASAGTNLVVVPNWLTELRRLKAAATP